MHVAWYSESRPFAVGYADGKLLIGSTEPLENGAIVVIDAHKVRSPRQRTYAQEFLLLRLMTMRTCKHALDDVWTLITTCSLSYLHIYETSSSNVALASHHNTCTSSFKNKVTKHEVKTQIKHKVPHEHRQLTDYIRSHVTIFTSTSCLAGSPSK